MNRLTSITLTIEDLLSIRSASVSGVLDKYFCSSNNNNNNRNDESTPTSIFTPFYLDTILIEPLVSNGKLVISMCNYEVRTHPKQNVYSNRVGSNKQHDAEIIRRTSAILLYVSGWNSLKRVFDCIESYYNMCAECSPVVESLIVRYSRLFEKHYRATVLLSTSNSNYIMSTSTSPMLKLPLETVRHITSDLPLFLSEINERRLPPQSSFPYNISAAEEQQRQSVEITTLRQALMPWIDSEVRRFCAANICESVLQYLKYNVIVW